MPHLPEVRHLLCLHHAATANDWRFRGVPERHGWRSYSDDSWDVECGAHIPNDPNMQRVTGLTGRTTCPRCLKRPRRSK